MTAINAFSIDLEHWWYNEFLKEYLPEEKEDQISDSVKPLLNLLDKHNTRATFFISGEVAEDYPEIVETVYQQGHEVASHAYSHKMLRELGKDKFEAEIKKSVKLLYNIVKEKPRGFRAPSFSINNDTWWAFEILEKYGFVYDSSIFPISKMFYYGVPDAPLGFYRPSRENIALHDSDGNIVEVPLTVLDVMGVHIPIAGGFYLRLLPLWFIKWGIKTVNKTRPAVVYVHPWELNPKTPRLQAPFMSKFEAYHGIRSAFKKVAILLREFKFKPIDDLLYEI
jgi:polysaccharide deacetylase family protein (PEP-CTERM system associated)